MSGNVQTAVTVNVFVTLDFNHVLSKLTLFIYLQEYCKKTLPEEVKKSIWTASLYIYI